MCDTIACCKIAADNSCQEPKVISNTPAFFLSHVCLAKWESQILIVSENLVCMPPNCLQNILTVETPLVVLACTYWAKWLALLVISTCCNFKWFTFGLDAPSSAHAIWRSFKLTVYLLSGDRRVKTALRVILNPMMPSLVIIVLAVGNAAGTWLWGSADCLQVC